MRGKPMAVLVVVLAAGAGGLVALVGDRGNSNRINVVAAAATKSVDAGSAKVSFTVSMSGPAGGGLFDLTGRGEQDFAHQRAHMTMDMGSMLQNLPGAKRSLPPGSSVMEMIQDGPTLYMRSPLLASVAGASRPWIKLDVSTLGGLGDGGTNPFGATQGDPSRMLEMLAGASDAVVQVGREQVDGTSTTHYRAEVSMDRAIDRLPARQRDQLKPMAGQFAQLTGARTFPVDVWIDGAGLPRKVQMALEIRGTATGVTVPALTMTMTLELSDWGTPVTVTPPPADQVTDVSRTIRSNGRGLLNPGA